MDSYLVHVDDKMRKRQRYAIPLGVCLFSFIMYMSFFRNYGESDSKTFKNLTRDICDRYPEAENKLGHFDMKNESIAECNK